MNFDTLYELCMYYYKELDWGTAVKVSCSLHDIPLTFNIYKASSPLVDSSEFTFSLYEDGEAMEILLADKLVVEEEAYLSPSWRCKGFTIFCNSVLTNNGEISMYRRGAVGAGNDIYLFKNGDGTYEFVPAIGAWGGAKTSLPGTTGRTGQYKAGNNGASGTGRQTGGGGAGGAGGGWYSGPGVISGAGSAGTSYSGGSGGGAVFTQTQSTSQSRVAGPAGGNGGAGGWGRSGGDSNWRSVAYGGVGNNNGKDGWANNTSRNVYANSGPTGLNGTGGLLIIYCGTYEGTGLLTSQGTTRQSYSGYNPHFTIGGGASGGGSINLFCGKPRTVEEVNYNVSGGRSTGFTANGGRGGDGTFTLTNLSHFFIFKDSSGLKVFKDSAWEII